MLLYALVKSNRLLKPLESKIFNALLKVFDGMPQKVNAAALHLAIISIWHAASAVVQPPLGAQRELDAQRVARYDSAACRMFAHGFAACVVA